MSLIDRLRVIKNKDSFKNKIYKSYFDAIQDLKLKYPYIKLDTYNRKFTIRDGTFKKFIDDLNLEYSLCGIPEYSGEDRYFIAHSTLEYAASHYSSLFRMSEKEDSHEDSYGDSFEDLHGLKKDVFKVNRDFLNRFDPIVTIFYLKIKK